MVLLTSSVLNPLILVLILSASGQNWCFWLFTVGLLFLFFFFSRWSYFFQILIFGSLLQSRLCWPPVQPPPPMLCIFACTRVWSQITGCHLPGWSSFHPLALLTIMSVPVTPNCLLSQIFSGSHTYTKLIINESMMFFLLFYHLILTTMLRSHLIIYSLFSFYEWEVCSQLKTLSSRVLFFLQ